MAKRNSPKFVMDGLDPAIQALSPAGSRRRDWMAASRAAMTKKGKLAGTLMFVIVSKFPE